MEEYASQKDRTLILVNVNMASLARIVKTKVRVSRQVEFELGILATSLMVTRLLDIVDFDMVL